MLVQVSEEPPGAFIQADIARHDAIFDEMADTMMVQQGVDGCRGHVEIRQEQDAPGIVLPQRRGNGRIDIGDVLLLRQLHRVQVCKQGIARLGALRKGFQSGQFEPTAVDLDMAILVVQPLRPTSIANVFLRLSPQFKQRPGIASLGRQGGCMVQKKIAADVQFDAIRMATTPQQCIPDVHRQQVRPYPSRLNIVAVCFRLGSHDQRRRNR